jgi:hypothetical protein
MQRVIDTFEMLRRLGQRLGPYLMIEILLPGGSLFALMLFLYQRRKSGVGRELPRPLAALLRALAPLLPQGFLVPQPCFVRPSRVVRTAFNNPSER